MSKLTMVVTAQQVSETEFCIVIAHDPAASWSRAVDPRATRAAREHMQAIRSRDIWALIDVKYGDTEDETGRIPSTYRYVLS